MLFFSPRGCPSGRLDTDAVTMTATMMMIMMIISQGMSVRSVGKNYNEMEDALYRLLLQDGDLLQRRLFSVCSLWSFCRTFPWQSRGAFILASISDGECGDGFKMKMMVE